MGFCRSLCVLLWKHMLVRKRRFIHTIAELIAPLVLMSMLFFWRHSLINVQLRDSMAIAETPLNNDQSLSRVLYTPYTPFTSMLMSEVGKSLMLTELEGEPNHITSGYWRVSNTSVLEKFMENMNYNEAIVIFQGLDGDTMSQKLNYTIRMKEPFLTSALKSIDNNQLSLGDIYTLFMNLQWAIDKSYLKLQTGSDLDQEVTFQELPQPRNKKSFEASVAIVRFTQTFCTLTLLIPFVFQVLRLLGERASGVVELIKIVGVTTNMVGVAHFINALPCGVVFSVVTAVLLTATSTPLFAQTNFGFISVALFLHYCSIIAIAYPVSYIMKSTNYSTSIVVLCYFILGIPTHVTYLRVTGHLIYLTGIFPFVQLYWFFDEISGFEVIGKPMQISDIFVKQNKDMASIFDALVFIHVQILLCFLIAWYLDKVRPGAYGVALPWNFLCKKSFWSNKVDPTLIDEVEPISKEDPRYFESPPKYLRAGIRVIDVSKVYGTRHGPKAIALSHLTVNFYEGEITVLLGHNGAGKTTLMSIMTGMISSTQGTVLVKGMDNIINREEVRRHLGFCPQNNMCFTDLTVLEHIIIFAMFKGLNYKQAKISSHQLIEKLKLEGKEKFKSVQLSGGMKRRLQLACALAGNATVLILDEPTSGLDVESRRELWNLLLRLRGICTVVISTHFMEEADALGDRVVAIHQGKLRCRATPMYLKKAVGTGYRLSLTLNKSATEGYITIAISKFVPEASVSDRTSTSITYKLPATSSHFFPKLFNELESRREELGIETIGVGVTTLEEVFLKLCSDVDTAEGVEQPPIRTDAVTFHRVTGIKLCCRILKVLIKRQLIATWTIKWKFIIIQVIVPVLIICFCTAFIKGEGNRRKPPVKNPPLMLNLDAYKDTGVRSVLLDMNERHLRHLTTVADDFPDFEFIESTIVSEADFYKYLIGLETNSTNVNLRYSTLLRHAAPVALNLYSNLRALELLPTPTAARTITTYNHPIEGHVLRKNNVMVETKDLLAINTWSILVTFMVMGSLINEVILPSRERVEGSRHIKIMSGCSPVLYWLVTLICHFVLYLVVIVFVTVLACLFLDMDKIVSAPDFLCTFVVILILGGLAFLLFVYNISFLYKEQSASVMLMVFLFVFGFILPLVNFGFRDTLMWYYKYCEMVFMIFPPYSFATASLKAVTTARANNVCRLNVALCPNIFETYSVEFAKVCCSADLTSTWGPFAYWVPRSGLTEIISMVVQIFIYGSLVILIEYGLAGAFCNKLWNILYKPPAKLYHDKLATEEEQYCQQCVRNKKKTEDAVLVHNLHKVYKQSCRKPVNAVKGTNFSVKKGECFGLLGVNGAGKSTTFKMLTGEEACTRGSMFANGYSISQRSKYMYSMAYCPQFGGLDMFLSGEQNLKQLLVIRGLRDSDVNKETKTWLGYVGLEQYAKRKASGYSGGCLRRLAAAVALASGAPVSLLDEPTTGVDTAARRRVWIALKRGLAQKRSIIITSHSMDEMEALCNRIAIMSYGEICALGSPPALRAAHGVGLSLRLKLKSHNKPKDGSQLNTTISVENLKANLMKTYPGRVRDEHSTMLHYHMDNKEPYSEVFQYMEQLRKTYADTLEDYSVTETTLEEVFLSFCGRETLI